MRIRKLRMTRITRIKNQSQKMGVFKFLIRVIVKSVIQGFILLLYFSSAL
jgi:hypothetical protein